MVNEFVVDHGCSRLKNPQDSAGPPAQAGSALRYRSLECLFRGLHNANLVYAAAGYVDAAIGSCNHVAYRASAGGDWRFCELLRLWIETHHGVGFYAGFAVPRCAVWRDGDSIGRRFCSFGGWPHFYRASCGIQPPQISALVICEINPVLGIDGHSPRAGAFR